MMELSASVLFIHILNILIYVAAAVLVIFLIVRAVKRRKATPLENRSNNSEKNGNKRMLFGGLLFFSGFLGVVVLIVVAALKPIIYNDETGIMSTMTAMGTVFPFIIFCVMAAAGIVICIYEAYLRK
jgi:nitrate reductase gamma subunit